MIDIKVHATERYVERVMEIDITDIGPSATKLVNDKIILTLAPIMKQIVELESGSFQLDGFTYVIYNLNLITVKKMKKDFYDRQNN